MCSVRCLQKFKSTANVCRILLIRLGIPLQLFTSLAMDLISPLPATKSGHTWIVTWVDRTSKMIVAAAAKEGQISSEALALMTFREIFCRVRLPLHQTINNDVKFVSALWQSLWDLCGTKLRFTSIYNPQSDPANVPIDSGGFTCSRSQSGSIR